MILAMCSSVSWFWRLPFSKCSAGVDEQHVVRLLALLQHEDADRDAGGVEQVGGQADDGVDVAVLEQLGADAFLRAATEQHAVRQDDGHHAFVLQEVEAVQQEGEVGGGLGGQAVVLEAHVLAHRLGRLPAVAEGRVGDDGVELRLLGGVQSRAACPSRWSACRRGRSRTPCPSPRAAACSCARGCRW